LAIEAVESLTLYDKQIWRTIRKEREDIAISVAALLIDDPLALRLATSGGHVKIVQILREHGAAGKDPKGNLSELLCKAAAAGRTAIVEQFELWGRCGH
jgi:hypothetical protein